MASAPFSIDKVVIIKGYLSNFRKSFCDALESGVFLWGFKEREDLSRVLKDRTRPVIFYVVDYGFAMIGRIKEEVDKNRHGLYWEDEIKAGSFIYEYRFLLEPVKVSKYLSAEACKEGAELSAKHFVSHEDARNYIARGCGMPQKGRGSVRIPLRLNANIVGRCIAEKLFEYLDREFVEFRPSQVVDPLFERLRGLSLGRLVLVAHLAAGRGLLLVGPPGSGKTSLLTDLLRSLGIGFSIETGNPEWTPYDTIGGRDIRGNVVEGFVTRAIRRCSEELGSRGVPHWLIIDEVNRANVDLAFGKLFTLLDPVYRVWERLAVGDEEVGVPLSFRLLATMNSFDRALLHKLGYALMRRFAVVRHEHLAHLEAAEGFYGGGGLEVPRGYDRGGCLEEVGVDLERVMGELRLGGGSDYLVLSPTLHRRLAEGPEVFAVGGLRLDRALACISRDVIDGNLRGYRDCEVCPVQVTPGVLADALKYVAVLNTLLKEFRQGLDPGVHARLVLDTALASYIIPQLDVLADHARLEEMSGQTRPGEGAGGGLRDVLSRVAKELNSLGLRLSGEMVGRLARGYHAV